MSFLQLSIENDAKDLMNIAGRQVPFALALALTRTAQLAQKNIRDHINETFVIRKQSGGFASSVRIKAATKQNLTAQVYSLAGFAGLQQSGGYKKAQHRNLAIPAYSSIGQVKRRNVKESPARILSEGGFIMRLKGRQQAIVKRDKVRGLQFLYFLRRQADVPKRLKMIETAQETVDNDFAMVFNKTLRDILAKV
jgi:hypothetical protein